MSEIIGIFGLQGSGKTMYLTYLGKRDYEEGKTIYSNYHLNNIPYVPIASLDDIDKIKDGTFLIDECWLWLFSRTSMTKLNQELLKIIMLNRKRGVNIYYTAQLSRSVDVLLKEVTNYFVYPTIKPCHFKGENDKEVIFRLCFYYRDLYGRETEECMLTKPLEYYGGYYDTKEEIGALKKNDDTPLEKGIKLETIFGKALSKTKFFNHVEVIPFSGSHSSWGFDVIGYSTGKTYAFDVKGVCKSRVYLNAFGKTLQDKIQNAKSHNAIPYIAFPRNDRVQLTNPDYWYILPLNYYSYLLKLSSNPAYNKLVEHSKRLIDLKKTDIENIEIKLEECNTTTG
jgi:Holliday junction resolvase